MIRMIAAALAAFVLASFGVRAEETKPADSTTSTAKSDTKKAEKKSHKKAKKAKKDAAAKTESATPAK